MEQDDSDDTEKQPGYKPAFTDKELVKIIAIGFVLATYFFIFLKILFLN